MMDAWGQNRLALSSERKNALGSIQHQLSGPGTLLNSDSNLKPSARSCQESAPKDLHHMLILELHRMDKFGGE